MTRVITLAPKGQFKANLKDRPKRPSVFANHALYAF